MPDSFVVKDDGTIVDLPAPAAPEPEPVKQADTPTPDTPETPSPPAEVVPDVPAADDAVPAPAVPADVPAEPAAADVPADPEEPEEPVKGSRAEKRIKGLLEDLEAVKKYADLWREEALKKVPASAEPAAAVPAVVPTAEPAPTLEAYGNDNAKWTAAMAAWTQRQIAAGVKAALQVSRQEQQAEAVSTSHAQREEAFEKTHPDYRKTVTDQRLRPLSQATVDLLLASGDGPDVMYHLGQNTDLAVQIARLSPAQQLASIGRIQGELAAKAAQAAAPKPIPPAPKPKPPNVSKAPPPPTPVSASSQSDPNELDPKMSMAEFVQRHRRQRIEGRKMLAPNQRPMR